MEGDNPAQQSSLPPKPSKKRKRTSPAWEHFVDVEPTDPIDPQAQCIHCGEIIPYGRVKYGTSGMLAHSRNFSGKKRAEGKDDPLQQLLSYDAKARTAGDPSVVGNLRLDKYDLLKLRRAVAKCIVIDELPFSIVQKEGFSEMLKIFEPRFAGVSRRSITRDCMALYIEEKEILRLKLLDLSPRICFTTDTWTCTTQNTTYMCLTTHFIDRSWMLHKRIIGFQKLHNHAGIGISEQLDHFMDIWGLEKVLTITINNATPNDKAVANFRKIQDEKFGSIAGHIIQNHNHLQVRCSSHILNLIVKEGLNELGTAVEKMKSLVKYVRSSPTRLESFNMYVKLHTRLEKKTALKDDIPTRWNSTYKMLESVLNYEEVFVNMIDADKPLDQYLNFDSRGRRKDVDLVPTSYDWIQVKNFTKFFKIFYDVTLKFSASNSVTANLFFQEVAKIDKQIQIYSVDEDECLSNMALKMQTKFDKYWGELSRVDLEVTERVGQDPNKRSLNHFLMVATVLDPRANMKWFNWWFSSEMSRETRIDNYNKVKRAIRLIFEQYEQIYGKSSNPDGVGTSQSVVPQDDYGFGAFNDDMSRVKTKSELEMYLDVSCVPLSGPFYILDWWKANESTYLVLSHMARDILAVPISTVPFKATFSIGGRVLDSTRPSLTPAIVEALILGQNWLSKASKDIGTIDREDVEEAENEEVETELVQTPQNFKW